MEEREKHTPNLSKIKKENPFGTPDNYFEDFSARLQYKLEAEKKPAPKPQGIVIRFLKPALGLAASFALIFLMVYWPIKTFLPKTELADANEPALEEMEYLTMVEGIDENSFYALLDEPDNTSELSEDDLIAYLSANLSEYDLYSGTDNYN
jgi:hypothetical protein